MNYYRRHIGDYLRDTAHLSLLEHGVYTRLLDIYYTREAPLPGLDQTARLVGARSREERQALELVLGEFFELVDGQYVQQRCERELQANREKAERNREVGAKGGRPKKNQNPEKTQTVSSSKPRENPDGFQNGTQIEPRENPFPIANSHIPPLGPPQGGGKRGSRRCPDDFEVTPAMREWAASEASGVDVERETRAFRDFEFSRAYTDWPATWRNWIRRAAGRVPSHRQDGGERPWDGAI